MLSTATYNFYEGIFPCKKTAKFWLAGNSEKIVTRWQIYVRKLTGGEISGTEYQFDVWPNAQEDANARVRSGDKYFVRTAYQAKVRELQDENWQQGGSGTYGFGEETKFFDAGA